MRPVSTSVISGLQHLLENLARGGLTCSGRRPGIPQTCRTARPEVRSRTQRRGRPSGISAGESSTSSNPMNVSKWGLRPPARVSCRTGLQGYGVTGLRGYERSPCELHKHRARHLPRSLSLSPCDSVRGMVLPKRRSRRPQSNDFCAHVLCKAVTQPKTKRQLLSRGCQRHTRSLEVGPRGRIRRWH